MNAIVIAHESKISAGELGTEIKFKYCCPTCGRIRTGREIYGRALPYPAFCHYTAGWQEVCHDVTVYYNGGPNERE